MHEFTFDALTEIEDTDLPGAHFPTFWDADTAEQVHIDPDESWDVANTPPGEDGWDDPAEAIEIREQLANDTPTHRPRARPIDEHLKDPIPAVPEEGLLLLALELAADQVAA